MHDLQIHAHARRKTIIAFGSLDQFSFQNFNKSNNNYNDARIAYF